MPAAYPLDDVLLWWPRRAFILFPGDKLYTIGEAINDDSDWDSASDSNQEEEKAVTSSDPVRWRSVESFSKQEFSHEILNCWSKVI